MAVARITKRSVDATRPTDRDTFLWDQDLPGFGVKITPTGRRVFIAQYRIAGVGRRSTTKRLTLGDHGKLTPEEARGMAKRELGRVAQGANPNAERSIRRGAPTMKEFGEEYLTEVKDTRKKATHLEYKRVLEKHVLPALGTKPVAEVTSVDLRRLHRAMKKTPYLANRVIAMLGAFFRFARNEGVRKDGENPAHDVEIYEEQSRERFLTAEEFRRLGDALTRAETTGIPPAEEHRRKPGKEEKRKHVPKSAGNPIPANPLAVAAIRLLALTGCRENEILSLRWDAVDAERGYLRLADTKTGKSVRPIGAAALAILESLPHVNDAVYVFPGRKENDHLKEIKRLWHGVRAEAKLENLRIHDLRHSFASVPAASGESMLILKTLLGHARVSTTERYAHLGDDPVKRAADKASGDISAWLGVATPSQDILRFSKSL